MGILRISLFGTFRISHDDVSSEIRIAPKAQALLAYLLLQGRRLYPRERLAELFWTDHSPDRARRCLRTTLWRLRQALEPDEISAGAYLITTSNDGIGFNWNCQYWFDVLTFENQASQILAKSVNALQLSDIQTLEKTLLLYRGDLLEGFYDDWVIREQERLRSLYLDALEHLMRYQQHQANYEKALFYGQRILDLEPVHEEIHREMMRIYLASGQRALAIQQYETCRQILARELDLAPMEETQTLCQQARAGSANGQTPASICLDRIELQQALHQLGLATRHFNEAQIQLKRAKEKFDQAQQQLQQALRLLERAKKY